jgi:DNA-binding protein Fis
MEVIQDILNKEVINTILTITRGNQTTAASRLGINRGTLRTRISKIRKSNPLYDLPI